MARMSVQAPWVQVDPRARLERITKPFEEYRQRRDQALAKLRAPPEEDESHLFCWGGQSTFTFDEIPPSGVSVKIKDDDKKKKKPEKKTLNWSEEGRVWEKIRVENPEDPSQYVIVNRIKEIAFQPPGEEIKEWPQNWHKFTLKHPDKQSK